MFNLSNKTNIVILLLSCLIINGTANLTSYFSSCTENSAYTPNSTYRSNLNSLLTSMSSNASNLNGRKFHNATAGLQSDTVYSLYLCRGDVKDAVCQECVKTASTDVLSKCPNQKEAYIWYDECMLRYSNRSIFSLMEETPAISGTNDSFVNDPNIFDRTVEDSMNRLIHRAAYNSSGAMFGTQETKYNGSMTIYSLVQCTPDLSGRDCEKCLKDSFPVIQRCCSGRQAARVLSPSCHFRYEIYPFYANFTVAPSVPVPDIKIYGRILYSSLLCSEGKK